jgi:hypothetical protein
VIVPFYARAAVKFPELAARFDAKQNLTFCQPFAFGYMQRNPDWDKSPWTDCEELMRENFGVSDLSFLESARRNPEATLEHVAWNLRLVPNGLELLLFNRVGGRTNPDYVHVVVGSRATQAMGLLSLGLVIVAAWRVWPRRRQLWMDVLQPPAWGWVLLGCVVLATVPVILTQRPRPSYLLAAGVAMQAFLALCAYASISTLPLRRWIERGSAVGLVIAVLGIAPIYGPDYVHVLGGHSGQLLTQQVRNLLPLKDHLMVDSPKILAARLGSETCLYVSRRNDCLGFTPASLLADKPTRAKVGDWIALRRVTHIYVDDAMRADRSMSDFLESDAREGAWTRVGGSDASWELLEDSSLRE